MYSINIFINCPIYVSLSICRSLTTSPLFALCPNHILCFFNIVLASKGIDASLVDAKVERKASIPRLTAEQDRRIEALRKELTAVEERLREANEMELPEEDLRIESESKREELNVLIAAFHEANFLEKNGATGSSDDGKLLVSTNKPTSREQEGSWKSVTKDGSGLQRAPLEYTGTTSTSSSSKDGDGAAGTKKFERPSERRRRLEQEKGGGGYDDRGRYGGGGGGNDDAFSNFGNNRGGGGRGDGRGGGGYNNRNNDEGYNNGGRGHQSNNSNNSGYNEKYASDRYNY